MKLEKFLKIKDGKIILPINEYEFVLSRQSAENIVTALQGALKRMDGYDAKVVKHKAEPIAKTYG